jgi:hypothetical protein
MKKTISMMTNQSKTIRVIAAVAFLALCSSPVQAQILFKDNFEGVAIGSAPNNGAQPGDWVNKITPGNDVVMVTNIAPPEGSQDLRIFQEFSAGGISASLASPVTSQEMKLALYAQTPSSVNINVANAGFTSFGFTKNTTDFSSMVDAVFSSNNVLEIEYHNNGSSQHRFFWRSGTSTIADTGLSWTVGQWDRAELTLLPGLGASGGDAFVLSISNLVSGIVQTTGRITFDGPTVSSSVYQLNGNTYPTITRAAFGSYATSQNYFLDDIFIALPEPASALLFGLGGWLLLLAQRKR